MNLTEKQKQILKELILDDFEIVYEEIYTPDFVEVTRETGGDTYRLRYYPHSDDRFECYSK